MSLFSRKRKRALRRGLGGALMRVFGPAFVRVLAWTWRTEITGRENLLPAARPEGEGPSGKLIALWHGRMLVGVNCARGLSLSVLVSPSADGQVSERVLRALGYRVIRGSASRGGRRALREMLKELRAGGAIVITPDGPRGPRHKMNPGLAWMSRVTGFPVIPVGLAASSAWRLSSWDSFTIPKPFARVAIIFGDPIEVSREIGEGDLEAITERIRASIFEHERRAFAQVGAREDW